jgi:predicted DNA-binding transcriptional regulator AlpA
MSNPVRHERRAHPERRTEDRRKSGSVLTPGNALLPLQAQHGNILPTDRLWTVQQAATFLGRSTSWVYKAAERGQVPRARGLGWGLRFVPAELHDFARGERASPSVLAVHDEGSE